MCACVCEGRGGGDTHIVDDTFLAISDDGPCTAARDCQCVPQVALLELAPQDHGGLAMIESIEEIGGREKEVYPFS